VSQALMIRCSLTRRQANRCHSIKSSLRTRLSKRCWWKERLQLSSLLMRWSEPRDYRHRTGVGCRHGHRRTEGLAI